ncbi:Ribosomal RNA-processing protein 8 [Apostasia shenzhenica]|uniref:Ribosomal RNA-processing protein 8 n=1 Tax=Apostasia shenzhenica TaxID=1088818 RepID=A0A2I0BEC7_9ASPA|nr:Ribosomal RNA-processing protein 8 [Apostasia shenzhenica]
MEAARTKPGKRKSRRGKRRRRSSKTKAEALPEELNRGRISTQPPSNSKRIRRCDEALGLASRPGLLDKVSPLRRLFPETLAVPRMASEARLVVASVLRRRWNASLAKNVKNKVFSIDLVSTDPLVIACDMSNVWDESVASMVMREERLLMLSKMGSTSDRFIGQVELSDEDLKSRNFRINTKDLKNIIYLVMLPRLWVPLFWKWQMDLIGGYNGARDDVKFGFPMLPLYHAFRVIEFGRTMMTEIQHARENQRFAWAHALLPLP